MSRVVRLLFALAIIALALPGPALAQESEWLERRTERFSVLYVRGDEQSAEQYAGFVDTVYAEVAAIFGHETATPVSLRLYPSLERYYQLNPLARGLEGVVAHADFRRHEVVVIIPQTASQTPAELQNNVRHELTHIVVAELSDERLNPGFQEGIAQYVEHPSRELDAKRRLLQRAYDEGLLLPWSELEDRDSVYGSPQISYPQTLSMIAFLVERHSFARLRELLDVAARSSGYRSALERTFGESAAELERQWREWLPSYLAGNYRRSASSAYDLSLVESLLRQGRYLQAQQELETAIEWLRQTDQQDVLQRAESLLDRSLEGQRADALAAEARAALVQGDYQGAAAQVEEARDIYGRIGDMRQAEVLDIFARRAERGQRAHELLKQGRSLARALRYPQAREAADQAAQEFMALGDRARARQALALRTFLDRRQSLLGSLLLLFGLGGVAVSLVRRLQGAEAEVW